MTRYPGLKPEDGTKTAVDEDNIYRAHADGFGGADVKSRVRIKMCIRDSCTTYQMRNFYMQFRDGFFTNLDVMNYIQHLAAAHMAKKMCIRDSQYIFITKCPARLRQMAATGELPRDDYEIGQQFYHPKHNPLYLQYSSNSYQNHGHSEYPG